MIEHTTNFIGQFISKLNNSTKKIQCLKVNSPNKKQNYVNYSKDNNIPPKSGDLISSIDNNILPTKKNELDLEYQDLKLKPQNQSVVITITIDSSDSESKHTKEECVICFQETYCVSFACGHRSCGMCRKKWKKICKTCPICRKNIFN